MIQCSAVRFSTCGNSEELIYGLICSHDGC